MPLDLKDDTPKKFPNPSYLTLDSFKRGVITLIDKSRLPKDALEEADNIFLVEDGMPSPRPGVDWFGTSMTSVRKGSPIVTTNLIPNPNFETNTTSWTGFQCTLARITSDFHSGVAALEATATSAAFSSAYINPTGLTLAGVYSASVYVKAPVGTTVGLSADPTFNGFAAAASTTTAAATGAWQLLTLTTGATSNTANNLVVYFTGATIGQKLLVDDVILVSGTTIPTYFDGTTTSTGSTTYAWTGTTNASTSTRSVYTYEPYEIDGLDYYDSNGTIHLLAVAGGVVYRSLDDGTIWTACTGATLTIGTTVNMNQNGGYMYLTNGVDNIVRYDGSTTLLTYNTLTTPAAPSVVKTGLGATTYTYYYKISAVNQIGFSAASAAGSVSVSLTRDAWDSTTNFVTITGPAFQATQTRADIYMSEDNLDYYYIGSTTSTVFKDDGTGVVVASTTAPSDSTATGPKIEELTNVGSRQYGVRDTVNRNRIWYTGTDTLSGAFSPSFDGGYLEWQKGGKLFPVKVADYRDGKGTPLATIWCDSADGQGAIIQMSLDVVTVGDVSVSVPSAYLLPGSRGTSAPGSVVNVLNDYMFYNQQAFYNLGSRAQFLNLLSTDEASANIRPTVKQISTTGENQIASVYYDAKVYFSVPYGTSTSNYTAVYDTERKAWLPTAFTLGFKKFLRYTDTTGIPRLLALKPGDTRLSQIDSSINGDYGQAFATSLVTGLYPVSKNRFEFQWVEEGEVELSGPQGTINLELIGFERSRGFSSTNSETIQGTVSGYGWDSFAWDTVGWDDTSVVPVTYAESSVKRYFKVDKELNALQWRITTNSLDAHYVLRTLQTWGTETMGGKPRSWRL